MPWAWTIDDDHLHSILCGGVRWRVSSSQFKAQVKRFQASVIVRNASLVGDLALVLEVSGALSGEKRD